jgi:hypothetical protein
VRVDPGATLHDRVGSKLRVVCTVTRQEAPPEVYVPGEVVEQRRSGSWLTCDELERAQIVAPPQVIEGELGRSKGFFTLAGRLVSSSDLRHLLRGEVQAGERVRLHGQARDYVCGPQEQCLIGGSLPLFDVARAERLP